MQLRMTFNALSTLTLLCGALALTGCPTDDEPRRGGGEGQAEGEGEGAVEGEGEGAVEGEGEGADPGCTPGDVEACSCKGSIEVRRCLADGTWEACPCPAEGEGEGAVEGEGEEGEGEGAEGEGEGAEGEGEGAEGEGEGLAASCEELRDQASCLRTPGCIWEGRCVTEQAPLCAGLDLDSCKMKPDCIFVWGGCNCDAAGNCECWAAGAMLRAADGMCIPADCGFRSVNECGLDGQCFLQQGCGMGAEDDMARPMPCNEEPVCVPVQPLDCSLRPLDQCAMDGQCMVQREEICDGGGAEPVPPDGAEGDRMAPPFRECEVVEKCVAVELPWECVLRTPEQCLVDGRCSLQRKEICWDENGAADPAMGWCEVVEFCVDPGPVDFCAGLPADRCLITPGCHLEAVDCPPCICPECPDGRECGCDCEACPAEQCVADPVIDPCAELGIDACLQRPGCEWIPIPCACDPDRGECPPCDLAEGVCMQVQPRRCEDLRPDQCRFDPACAVEVREICRGCACGCPEPDCICDCAEEPVCELVEVCVTRPANFCEGLPQDKCLLMRESCEWIQDEACLMMPCREGEECPECGKCVMNPDPVDPCNALPRERCAADVGCTWVEAPCFCECPDNDPNCDCDCGGICMSQPEQPACQNDADCPAGMFCNACPPDPNCPMCAVCGDPVCQPIQAACDWDMACGPGEQCVNGVCVAADPCAGVACPAGQICSQGRCIAAPPQLPMAYDLTQCADPWQERCARANLPLERCIEDYAREVWGVALQVVNIDEQGRPIDICADDQCACATGRVLHVLTDERGAAILADQGFYFDRIVS